MGGRVLVWCPSEMAPSWADSNSDEVVCRDCGETDHELFEDEEEVGDPDYEYDRIVDRELGIN